jgi:S-adenosylmethionine synthetase
VRDTIVDVGYTDAKFGLDGDTCGVITAIQEQSPTSRSASTTRSRSGRALGDELDTSGAGDQG